MLAFVLLSLLAMCPSVRGHGLLQDPPARNTMWREGFDTPKNYNDMGLNCGGAANQWDTNDGKCGLCGDPWQGPRDHEAGGAYAPDTRPVTRCYNKGSNSIDISVKITAYHKGYFEFHLCENNNMAVDPTQSDCLDDDNLLTVTGTDGETRYDINAVKQLEYHFQLDMPDDVQCTQCILRWKYNAGNSHGCDDDGNCGIGLGEQEQFINCADISILPDCGSVTNPPTVPTTTDPYSTVWTEPPITTVWTEPPTTDPVTTTDAPTAAPPSSVCRAVGMWAGVGYMDDWCDLNCHHTDPYCPEIYCSCYGVDNPPPTACESAGGYRSMANMDTWCTTNCLDSPLNPICPAGLCTCF